MFEVKNINVKDFNSKYRNNIQLQFNADQKFVSFMESLANYGVEYMQTLKTLATQFNLNNPELINNTYLLNTIGYMLNLPPITSFPNITPEDYILLIKGQQAKNLYNGTNKSILDILNQIFEGKFRFFLEDKGNMEITIFLIPITTLSETERQLYLEGYFTPKPAGVFVTLDIAEQVYFAWDTEYSAGTIQQLAGWNTGVWN